MISMLVNGRSYMYNIVPADLVFITDSIIKETFEEFVQGMVLVRDDQDRFGRWSIQVEEDLDQLGSNEGLPGPRRTLDDAHPVSQDVNQSLHSRHIQSKKDETLPFKVMHLEKKIILKYYPINDSFSKNLFCCLLFRFGELIDFCFRFLR